MTIHGQIRVDAVAALKARLADKREALAFLMNEMNVVAKNEKLDSLPDDRALSVLRKSIKQRRETLEAAKTADRPEMVKQAEYEIGIIEGYLPAGLSLTDMTVLAEKVITQLGASSVKDMGRVMTSCAAEAPTADKSQLSGIVKSLLSR